MCVYMYICMYISSIKYQSGRRASVAWPLGDCTLTYIKKKTNSFGSQNFRCLFFPGWLMLPLVPYVVFGFCF